MPAHWLQGAVQVTTSAALEDRQLPTALPGSPDLHTQRTRGSP